MKQTFEVRDINQGLLILELEPGEYKIDYVDSKLFDAKCNCFFGFKIRFNNTNFKVENETSHITPYALTSLTYTENPKNNKTKLTGTTDRFKKRIRKALEKFKIKHYDKNWKIM